MSTGGPPMASKPKAHLDRVRDNQRRSRARRKEYLNELEEKFRQCEQQGVEASSEMQLAARRVLEENARLRAFLREKGVSDREMDEYTGAGLSYDDDDDLAVNTLTTTLTTPISATQVSQSGGRRPSAPIQELTTLLTTRKPCCLSRSGSQDPTRIPGTSANSSYDEDSSTPTRQLAQAGRNDVASRRSGETSRITSMLQPGQHMLPPGKSSAQALTTISPLVTDVQTFGTQPSYATSQSQWQQYQRQVQAQNQQLLQQNLQPFTQMRPQHRHTSSYSSGEAATSYPLGPPSLTNLQPSHDSAMSGTSMDMSNLLPRDIQAQFLRGLDNSNHACNSVMPTRTQGMPNSVPSYTDLNDFSDFKLEDGMDAGFATDWPDLQGPTEWSALQNAGQGTGTQRDDGNWEPGQP